MINLDATAQSHPKFNDIYPELLMVRNVKEYSPNLKALLVDSVNERTDAAPFTSVIPSCNPIPTQAEINNSGWTYEEHMYSLSDAISLKIPVVNVSGSTSLKLYIKDYKRLSAPCDGGNGNRLYYGQIIRTIIEIDNYDASMGVSLTAFAASATLNKSTQHFYFYKSGFYNSKIDSIISNVSGKNFNVENYYLFQQTLPAIQALLNDRKTTFSPAVVNIDYENTAEKLKLTNASFIVYALQNIAKQKSYASIITKFASSNAAVSAIAEVYDFLEVPKDNTEPTKIQSLQAMPYLNGLNIRW